MSRKLAEIYREVSQLHFDAALVFSGLMKAPSDALPAYHPVLANQRDRLRKVIDQLHVLTADFPIDSQELQPHQTAQLLALHFFSAALRQLEWTMRQPGLVAKRWNGPIDTSRHDNEQKGAQ